MSGVISQPSVTINIVENQGAPQNEPMRVLFIGQKTAGGIATADEITNIGVSGEEISEFGNNSMLTNAIRAFRTINKKTHVDAIALDDEATGTEATATITVSGTATTNKKVKLNVQSKYLLGVEFEIEKDDTGENVASKIQQALNDKLTQNISMFSSAVNAGVVTLTCTQKGTVGNDLLIYLEDYAAETGITISVSPFASNPGTLDPSVDNALAAIGDNRYQYIVYPYNYDLGKLKVFLEDRFNVENEILDGTSIIVHKVNSTDVTQIVTVAGLLNSATISLVADKHFNGESVSGKGALFGSASLELGYVNSAKIAAIRTLLLTDGADVSKYLPDVTNQVVTNGGAIFNVIPYHNTQITQASIIAPNMWFSKAELVYLNDNGVATFGNNPGRTKLILGEMVTTRTINDQGLPDKVFKFKNILDGALYSREFFFNANKEKYAQTLLTTGSIISSAPMANEKTIRQFQSSLYTQLAEIGIVASGDDARNLFLSSLKISIDGEVGRINMNASLMINSAVRVIIENLQIS